MHGEIEKSIFYFGNIVKEQNVIHPRRNRYPYPAETKI